MHDYEDISLHCFSSAAHTHTHTLTLTLTHTHTYNHTHFTFQHAFCSSMCCNTSCFTSELRLTFCSCVDIWYSMVVRERPHGGQVFLLIKVACRLLLALWQQKGSTEPSTDNGGQQTDRSSYPLEEVGQVLRAPSHHLGPRGQRLEAHRVPTCPPAADCLRCPGRLLTSNGRPTPSEKLTELLVSW